MQFKKIVTISLNPALDITLSVDGLIPEKINSVLNQQIDAAGKAVNIAKLLHSFGIDPHLITFAGTENSEKYFKHLRAAASTLEYEMLLVDGEIRENLHIVLPDESLVTVRQNGFTVSPKDISDITKKISNHFAEDTLFIISGRFPDGFSSGDFRSLCQTISERGGLLAVDSNSVTYDDIVSVKPFIIKPNLDELKELTGRSLSDKAEIKKVLSELSHSGLKNILLSLGADGLIYYSENFSLHAAAPKVKVLSTVGAGDCTLAGFVLTLLSSYDIPTAIKTATAFGSAAVSLPGTKTPCEKEVVKLFSQISLSEF